MSLGDIFKLAVLIQRNRTTYSELAVFVMHRQFFDNQNFFSEVCENLIAERKYSSGLTPERFERAFRDSLKVFQAPFDVAPPAIPKQSWLGILNDYVNVYFLANNGTRLPDPEFSVIIPTHNGAEIISETIRSLLCQKGVTASCYEIIVVDDASSDGIQKTIQPYIEGGYKTAIRYVRLAHNVGPAAARNIGIIHARGSFVCFTDDDCSVPENWIAKFQEAFSQNSEIAGAGGWYHTYENASESLFDKYLYWHQLPLVRRIIKSASLLEPNYCGNTANVCYRKKALLLAGGFNTIFLYPSLDDWELKIRMQLRRFPLLSHPNSVRHNKTLTLISFVRHAMVRGWGRFLVYKLHGVHPLYYNPTLFNIFLRLALEWRSLLTNKDGSVYMQPRMKFLFFAISIISAGASWFGKYWVPFELLSRRQR